MYDPCEMVLGSIALQCSILEQLSSKIGKKSLE